MKKYADTKRSEREFLIGGMVYLKLQPFRHTTFDLHQNLKLTSKYYGPFKILEKIGQATYMLQLPASADIHPVFHVSQLKKHIGPKAIPQTNLPLVTPNGYFNFNFGSLPETTLLLKRNSSNLQPVYWSQSQSC
jgi:hypothetical protein